MIAKIFKHKTDHPLIQMFRYGSVGGLSFLIDFSALFILTEYCRIHYQISAALAFTLGLITSYTLSVLWVFHKRKLKSRVPEFTIFAMISIVGLGLNELFMWIFTEHVHLHYLVSKVVFTGLYFIFNFFTKRKLLFT